MIQHRRGFGIQWHDKREALVHMTKDGPAKANLTGNLAVPHTAWEKLISILQDRKIKASFVNHMDQLDPDVPRAVSFSEALPDTVSQLVYHPNYQNFGYGPYGIMVHKEPVFANDGAPVWYVNNEEFKALTRDPNTTKPTRNLSQELLFLLSPYAPYWSPLRSHRKTPMDWTQEREWRCPKDFDLPILGGRPDFLVIVQDDKEVQAILGMNLVNGLTAADFVTVKQTPNCTQPLLPHIY